LSERSIRPLRRPRRCFPEGAFRVFLAGPDRHRQHPFAADIGPRPRPHSSAAEGSRGLMALPPPAPSPPAMRDTTGLARFVAAQPPLLDPLRALAALDLPDAWIGAGFLRNAVWDALHGLSFGTNPPGDGDVVWFDPARASEAEDKAVEAQLRASRPGIPWSVRNQARMAARNGDAPYAGTLDAMARWPETATAVAARLAPAAAAGAVELAAPWGVDDLLAGIVRPTPAFAADPAKRRVFAHRVAAKAWRRRWPGLRVLQAPPPTAVAAAAIRPPASTPLPPAPPRAAPPGRGP
jgi:uncharacterized protein